MKTSKRGGLALVVVLAAAVVALACAVVPLSAVADGDDTEQSAYEVDADNKTITVTSTSEDDYTQNTGIQDAINYIYETYASSIKCDQNAKESELAKYSESQINTLEGDEDGWTIVVESGTYNRFTVLSYLDYLTIEAADEADVTIMVLDGSDAPVATSGGWLDTAGVCVRNASYVTLDGFTFEAYSYQSTPWYAAAVSSHNEVGYYAYGMTVTNCTFNGIGGSYGTGNYAVLATSIGCFYVKGCTFDSWYAAVCWMTDNYAVSEVVIDGNTFTNCDRACDGYFGNGNNTLTEDEMGTFQFTNNTVTGTYDLYSKVLIADQYATTSSANHDATGKVTLSGNTLEYAEFLLLDLDTNLEAADCDVTEDNTFGDNAFVVQGSEATAVFNVTFAFEADSDQVGYWEMLDSSELESLAIVGVGWTDAEAAIIVAAIEAANASGSHTLTLDFSSIYEEGTENYTSNWAWTVVRMKYGVRWVGSEGDDPTIEKDVSQEYVVAGDKVDFSLTVSAPEYLYLYFEDDIEEKVTEEGSYIVTVHDTMDSVLELDASSIEVSVNGVTLDSYRYTLITSGLEDECTFEIEIDLVSLVEAGILVADDSGAYPDVIITYSATVVDDAEVGTYENTTWLAYETDTTEPSTVEVPVNEYVDVTVTKVWDDSEDADELRPDSVTVELYADGEATGLTVTLSEDNDWTDTFEDLVVYVLDEDGNATEIAYTVVEVAVDGYATTVTGSASEGYVVTNTHTVTVDEDEPATVTISVEKAWDDDDDAEGLRPESVTVELYANGVATGETVVLSEVNGWYDVFSGLDAYDEDGEAIAYAIAEVDVPEGYAVSYSSFSGSIEEGYSITVTNTLVEEDEESTDSTEPTSDTTTSVPSTGDVTGTGYVALAVAAGLAAVAGALALRRRVTRGTRR